MYKKTEPHEGFKMLLEMGTKLKNNEYFAYTSNVDGHFQKAGFPEDKVVECHGTINYCQCNRCAKIVPMPVEEILVDHKECIASKLPLCEVCKTIMRPNILMFGDYDWIGDITQEQGLNYYNFLQKHRSKENRTRIAVIEVGAGLAVPTIRYTGEQLLENDIYRTTLVRLNMSDFECSIPSDILRVNEENVDKFPEAEESKETFLKRLTMESTTKGKKERGAMLIEMKAGGLQGIKLIYNAIKEYSP